MGNLPLLRDGIGRFKSIRHPCCQLMNRRTPTSGRAEAIVAVTAPPELASGTRLGLLLFLPCVARKCCAASDRNRAVDSNAGASERQNQDRESQQGEEPGSPIALHQHTQSNRSIAPMPRSNIFSIASSLVNDQTIAPMPLKNSNPAEPGQIDSPQRRVLHVKLNDFARRKNRQAQLQRHRRSDL